MFSRTAGYAVQALAYLATQSPGRLTGAREIAEATRIPMPFLWKILRNLSRKKLVRSFKGVRGGYELARSADGITIKQILQASNDRETLNECVLGLGPCQERRPCVLHSAWAEQRESMDALFASTSLSELARSQQPARRRKQV
jgi:Rrf2 family transcriptional regulator, iron-sulfur cluster assembly transcription factor